MSSGKEARDADSDQPLLDIERGQAEQYNPSCSLEAQQEYSLACIWSEVV